jgi:hypothetical protein
MLRPLLALALVTTSAACDFVHEEPEPYEPCYGCFADAGPSVGADASWGGDDWEWGVECDRDSHCYTANYCEDGLCVPSGECTGNFDCQDGFVCDPDRRTCIPSVSCTADADCTYGTNFVCDTDRGLCVANILCQQDTDCGLGCYCDNGYCMETGFFDQDADCLVGFMCDVARTSCIPDPGWCQVDGDCASGETCNEETGDCYVPGCDTVTDETACFERVDCAPLYRGIDCTDPNGNLCGEADSSCTCESFLFTKCESLN